MKAISTIIAIVLLILIIVALVSLFWTFSISIFSRATETGTASVTHVVEALTSCMEIASTSHNTLYVRNCGSGVLTNDSLNIFIDNNKFNFSMTPESIASGELANVEIKGLWGISVGDHILTLANPKTDLRKEIEVELPDSCVLALDFDEGSGNVTYDSSGYENNGYLRNGTQQGNSYSNCTSSGGNCPEWVEGKFGSALEFTLNQQNYVFVPYSDSLHLTGSENTISVWVELRGALPGAYRPMMIDKGGNAYRLDFNPQPQFNFYNASSDGFQANDFSTTVELGNWYHFLATINGTNVNLFTNGDEVDVLPFAGVIDNANNILIAQYVFGDPNYNLNGTIDSVRIFTESLTPDETVILKIK